MHRIIVTAFILLFTTVSFAGETQTKIDKLIQKYNDLKLFNGTVLVADQSGVIFKKGYGYANMEWGIPNQTDTRFRLGSITKQFTAMVIMQLVDEGKIKLDGKITDYLDYYRKDTGEKVTIHHLLVHTSGIPSYTSKPGYITKVSRNFYTPDDFVKEHCMGDLEFEPGSNFLYNNSAYFILGAIIEKLTGKSYEDALQERIFKPLGMTASGFDRSENIIEKRAAGYEKRGLSFVNANYLDMSQPYSAGSLYSTAEDLYKWDRALYENALISRESKEKYFTPHYPALGGHYAYGWILIKNKDLDPAHELDIQTHGGGIHGFNTLYTRIPEKKIAVILLNNTGGTMLNEISNSILNVLYGREFNDPKKPISLHIGEMLESKGIDAAVSEYRDIRKNNPDKFIMREQELNGLGYYLLSQNKIKEAVAVLALNVEAFPNASNAYDSYGEVLLVSGDTTAAIINYKKALELNPSTVSASAVLKKLGVETEEPVVINPEVLKLYAGKYELEKNFVFTVTAENNHLFVQATGQQRTELFPLSDKKFYVKVVDAQFEFVKDNNGRVTSLILFQNGSEFPAAKIE